MFSHFDSKGSNYTTTAKSNVTSSHSLSSNSSSDDSLFAISSLNEEQLMEDLAIIDDLYTVYENDVDSFDVGSVALVARNVANKHKVLQDLCQSESDYIFDLKCFQQHYISFILRWQEAPGYNKIDSPSIKYLNIYEDLIRAHHHLLNRLSERLKIWGAGQIISDSFSSLDNLVDVYQAFLQNYSSILMAITKLWTFTPFLKKLESHFATIKKSIHDFLYYLQLPIFRLQSYAQAIGRLIQFSDPLQIDYRSLQSAYHSFKCRIDQVQERMKDSQAHFDVFEAARTISGCPIQLTPTRRLLLKSRLIKVDLDDLSSTTDIRTYILYNDQLIYCKQDDSHSNGTVSNKKQQALSLQYKGHVDLIHCDLRILSPAVCAKMVEVKRSFMSFRSAKKSANQIETTPTSPGRAYGFELVISENNMDILPGNFENATSSAGTPLKQRLIIRTQSLAEQNIWVDTLGKVIQHIKWLQANQHS